MSLPTQTPVRRAVFLRLGALSAAAGAGLAPPLDRVARVPAESRRPTFKRSMHKAWPVRLLRGRPRWTTRTRVLRPEPSWRRSTPARAHAERRLRGVARADHDQAQAQLRLLQRAAASEGHTSAKRRCPSAQGDFAAAEGGPGRGAGPTVDSPSRRRLLHPAGRPHAAGTMRSPGGTWRAGSARRRRATVSAPARKQWRGSAPGRAGGDCTLAPARAVASARPSGRHTGEGDCRRAPVVAPIAWNGDHHDCRCRELVAAAAPLLVTPIRPRLGRRVRGRAGRPVGCALVTPPRCSPTPAAPGVAGTNQLHLRARGVHAAQRADRRGSLEARIPREVSD